MAKKACFSNLNGGSQPGPEVKPWLESEFTEGIAHGVRKAGGLLAEHFPRP